jgi:NADPH:quinone reductase
MSGQYSAVYLTAQGSFDNLTVRLLDLQDPPANHVLIKLECSTINPSDYAFILGRYPRGGDKTRVGNEGSGTVIKSGGGDAADALLNTRVGLAFYGTWAEYIIAPVQSVFPLLDSVSFEQGCSLIVNPMTVCMFLDYVKKDNHRGFVQNAAASSLGKMLVKWANRQGVPHINLVSREEQVQILRNLGAEHVINTSEEGWKARAKEIAAKIGASCGFDAIGGTETNDMAEVLEDGGVVYNYGGLSGKAAEMSPGVLIFQRKRLEGLWLTAWIMKTTRERFLEVARVIQENIDVFANEFNQETDLNGLKDALVRYVTNSTNNKVLIRTRIN